MQPNPNSAAIALRDVESVIGSFLIAEDGSLLMKDLPAVFDASLLESIGPRLLRLGEVLGREGSAPDSISMRFAEYRLYLKFLRRGAVLAILSGLGVNASVLKMAVTLTVRRIEQTLPTIAPASRASRELHARLAAERGADNAFALQTNGGEAEPRERISAPPDTQPSVPVSHETTEGIPRAKPRVMYRGRQL